MTCLIFLSRSIKSRIAKNDIQSENKKGSNFCTSLFIIAHLFCLYSACFGKMHKPPSIREEKNKIKQVKEGTIHCNWHKILRVIRSFA